MVLGVSLGELDLDAILIEATGITDVDTLKTHVRYAARFSPDFWLKGAFA